MMSCLSAVNTKVVLGRLTASHLMLSRAPKCVSQTRSAEPFNRFTHASCQSGKVWVPVHIYGCTYHMCEQRTPSQRYNPQADLQACLPACRALPDFKGAATYTLCVIQCVAHVRSYQSTFNHIRLVRRVILKT